MIVILFSVKFLKTRSSCYEVLKNTSLSRFIFILFWLKGDFQMLVKNLNEDGNFLNANIEKGSYNSVLNERFSKEEVLAIQLEMEHDELEEWRENLILIKAKYEA